jgi:hypothetical protein
MESVGLGSLACSGSEIEKLTIETLREEHWLITLESRVLKKYLGLGKGKKEKDIKEKCLTRSFKTCTSHKI